MQLRPESAVRAGHAEVFKDSAHSLPLDCVGVAHSGERNTYENARLRGAAQGSWITRGAGDQTRVLVTVVEFLSPQDTSAWYAKISSDWPRCQGITVTQRADAYTFTDYISHVSETVGVMGAELLLSTSDGLMSPTPHGRALTAVSSYAVDVEVLGNSDQESSGSLHADSAAIARLVAIKATSAR
ncbi:Hypothetical conserved lipoprotein LppR [Mycobacteroides abscessus subsp. massiliense]|nr:Hypothetical conserved lipoprotein LppR [Mycobacteroides abscessus subsp. massiliense]